MPLDEQTALQVWRRALSHMQTHEPEALEWARSTSENTFKNLRTKGFLRQYCFVVYASGFRFRTVKARFDDLSEAFRNFDLETLSRMRSVKRVLKVFGNERKAKNFLDGAKMIALEGFPAFKKRLAACGPDILAELPGIGPITKIISRRISDSGMSPRLMFGS